MRIATKFRTAAVLTLPVCVLAVWLVAAELTEDPPPLPKPKSGDITGVIAPAEMLENVQLISRATGETFKPAELDTLTGEFAFKDLVGDATYDICIETTNGGAIEGIDLEFTDARLLRMAAVRREQLGLPAERTHDFSEADAEQLVKYVADVDDFLDIRRPIYIQGHGRRATMLVEGIRRRQYHAQKPDEIIWRIELWYFEFNAGGWQRVANQNRVLRRERTKLDDWRKISVEYYPQLSVFVSAEGKSEPVKFKIPDKADPARGRPAGTDPKLNTKPFILGVTAKTATTAEDGEPETDDDQLIVPQEQPAD